MVFADKIEDLCPHHNLRASAAVFFKRQGFATLLQWALNMMPGNSHWQSFPNTYS
jgi:hypothetical protein